MSAISDPISDMLTRIRNAIGANKKKVVIPSSNIKESIAKILMDEGFITKYDVVNDCPQKSLVLILKYSSDEEPAITSLKRLSSPGRRVYKECSELRPVYNNMGIWILSTSNGIITNKSAKKLNVGGELLCEIF